MDIATTKATSKSVKKILALTCLLFSCSKQSHWAFDQVHSEKKEFRSTKLTYHSHDPVRGIDLELLKTEEHLNVYLNIHSIPVKESPLIIHIEDATYRCIPYRLAGGQRFLIPDNIAQILIEALDDNKEVTLSLASYRTQFHPEDFSAKYEKLLHPFPFQNPYKLPF